MPTPKQYFAAQDESRRPDLLALDAMIRKEAPKLKPFYMKSASSEFVGYGKVHYKSKSGCEGDWFVLGLSNRKQYISLYACMVKDGKYIAEVYKAKLPKANIGKSCIRFKRLSDLDEKVLRQLIRDCAKIEAENGNEMYC